MVEVVNLTYGYDKKNAVLNNVSFTIKPGITALVGENGCGKSTLLKLLTGSIPCGFTFLIDGKDTFYASFIFYVIFSHIINKRDRIFIIYTKHY